MTTTDINKILIEIAGQTSNDKRRTTVLELSFALLEWMKIEPNAGNKPQLLSPQTQKLKDYLATAPQTVQPQLYRLSADNQNIRVRFAVLKKLKKDYISQLVDNDPGLGSYQSFIKGLTTQNGNGFIPAQPYFVHFITTPDYNKLVMVFNQGEQKRIVTFRNRLTNTQYNKIILQWQGIGTKSKPEIADLFWKSLDIKEVNKQFYSQIKERFDALLGIVKTQHSKATENQVKQFTVRLIGRYIFCWFLKEKEIIPHTLISKATIEATDNYYQNVLLKLFFETLNTKVQDRNPLTLDKMFEKIPYLNGGLFDENEEDKLFTKLKLDAWLLPFVEILESYDFTVDESSSQYQQVAVDPEMLGRIFENLLASQNEETEKLANQRKAFGAFYTPREIVDYMVNESIRAYLQTQYEEHIAGEKTKHHTNPEQVGDIFGNKKPQQLALETKRFELKPEEKEKIAKAITPLFASVPDASHLKKEEKSLLLQFMERIKILDPACGSGAFPMGILHKLVELNEALGTVKSSYELKKDILSQNIYGIDIMPMAIEIARLRAWLSLVLEEDYKPSDPKHNFGVKPLPNLDFKFVCANSLIDLGIEEVLKNDTLGLYKNYYTMLKELEELRTNFFSPTIASTEKVKLKTKYVVKRDEAIKTIEADSDIRLKDIAGKLKQWNPFDDGNPSPFFSPLWMFGINKGFDVVIGNPPYLRIQGIRETNPAFADELTKLYKSASGSFDLYVVFLERSLSLMNSSGIVNFIMPVKWTNAAFGAGVRKIVSDKKAASKIISFGAFQVFNASTYTGIQFFKNNTKSLDYFELDKDIQTDEELNNYLKSLDKSTGSQIPSDKLNKESWVLSVGKASDILKKINQQPRKLSDIFEKIFQGLATSKDDVYFLYDCTDEGEFIEGFSKQLEATIKIEKKFTKPLLKGEDVHRYEFIKTDRVVVFPYKLIDDTAELYSENEIKKEFPLAYKYLKQCEDVLRGREKGRLKNDSFWYRYIYPKNLTLFKNEKLMAPEISQGGNFSYDENGGFYSTTTIYGYIKKETVVESYKCLMAILNSKLFWWYLVHTGTVLANSYFRFKPNYVKPFPLPLSIPKDVVNSLEQLVEKVMSEKKKSPNIKRSSFEDEIDKVVYELYGLDKEDIAEISLLKN